MLTRVLSALIRLPRQSQITAAERARAEFVEQAKQAFDDNDLPRAQAVLELAVQSGSESAEIRRMLGSILGAGGQFERARLELERALALEPGHVAALADLGNVYLLTDKSAEAEACYLRALDHDPENRAVHLNLAVLHERTGRAQTAVAALYTLLDYPAYPEAVRVLVDLLTRIGRSNEAKAVCLDVLGREPEHAVAHAQMGSLLLQGGLQPQQALEHFEQAIALGHATKDLWLNRGIALQDIGRLDEAIASYETALRMKPGDELVRFRRARALLMRGEFERAWPDYELRLLSEDIPPPPRSLPAWNGKPLADGALFVYGEQGIGDEIMFASCLPDLMAYQSRVVIACSTKLEAIVRRSFPGAMVMSLDHARSTGTDRDFVGAAAMTAIGSLPSHFRRSRNSFPCHAGYLQADPALVEEYQTRLAQLGVGPKVGLSWRGGSVHTRQALRTLSVAHLREILSVPHVQFIDLQYDSKGNGEGIDDAIASGKLIHWPDALADYDRTAALVKSLDLVVSVCTAVIHLGGALGRPVLAMAPYSPEWRYGIEGSCMPWYPSVHVERQPALGDWTSVVRVVQARLTELGEN